MTNDALTPLQFKQAMVALELGEGDNHLLNYFDFLARHIPVKATHFLHVLPSFEAFNAVLKQKGNSLISNMEINDEVLSQMRQKVEGLITNKKISGFSLDIREGNPLEELLKDAKKVEPDLLVIGQKGNTSEHGILARNLARRANGDTMIVPEGAAEQLNHIMVPVDFSKHSIRALHKAIAIKKQFGENIKISCVHVYKMPDVSIYKVQKTYQQFQKMVANDHMDAFRAFVSEHAGEEAENIELKVIMQEEPGIAHYLLKNAKAAKADLVIVGAKGYSKVERLLLGSVTEKLLSLNDSIPTLVVK